MGVVADKLTQVLAHVFSWIIPNSPYPSLFWLGSSWEPPVRKRMLGFFFPVKRKKIFFFFLNRQWWDSWENGDTLEELLKEPSVE